MLTDSLQFLSWFAICDILRPNLWPANALLMSLDADARS